MRRHWVAVVMLLLLLPAHITTAEPTQGPLSPASSPIQQATTFLLDHVDAQGCIGGARVTAWSTMALVAAGHGPHSPAPSGATLVDGLKACEPGRVLQGEELTAIQRHLLAIIAAGEDPTDFNGRNWVQEVRSRATSQGFFDPNNPNSLNNDIFGILALIAAGASPQESAIVNASDRIMANQNNDGGWGHSTSLMGGTSDTDMTAAALLALQRAKRIHAEHPTATNALSYLQERARDTDETDRPGCFSTRHDLSNPDLDSTAWAILGLLALHQDPRAAPWTQPQNPWACLLSLQHENGGFPPAPGAHPSPWPTAYAMLALTGSPFATIHPDMQRPTAHISTSADPTTSTTVQLTAENVSFASWLHEDGELTSGTIIQWTPQRAGQHNFTILLLDENGLAATQNHPLMVLEPPAEGADDTESSPLGPDIYLRFDVPPSWPAHQPLLLRLEGSHNETEHRIDWGDGNTTQWLPLKTHQHTYTQPGTYTISAWAKTPDSRLHGPIQQTLIVQPSDPETEAGDEASTQAPTGPAELPGTIWPLFAFMLLILLMTRLSQRRRNP
jgi:hypothetical protein